MNNRLKAIAAHICEGVGFIDVGTDHGYIPCELALKGYSGKIIASDINPGPLETAKRNAALSDVSDKIRFSLSDGLADCSEDEVDTIVIAGMGGDNICSILDRAEWCMNERYLLILQPMTKVEILRYWLVNNAFEICSEELAEDSETVYQILTARYGGSSPLLSEAELFTGEYRCDYKYRKLLSATAARFEKILTSAKSCTDPATELNRLIYRQLREMEARYDKGE